MDENLGNGPGSILREERERRGLGIEEVASQLRLSRRQIEALEMDDYAALPGNVFVRGFIRNYARLLQLDPAPLCEAIRDALPEESMTVPRDEGIPFPSGSKRSWVHYAIWIVLLAFTILGYEIYHENHFRAPEPASAKIQVKPLHNAMIRVAPGPIPASAPAAVSAPIAASAPVAAASPVAAGPIRLAFSGAAWVEIRDANGRIVYSRLNPAGSEQHVSGTAPFTLVIGNAHKVKLFYEGKAIDLAPYTRIDVAHLTLK